MRVERTTIVLALLLFAVIAVKSAVAEPVAPSGFDSISSERAPVDLTNKSVEANAGNVTQLEFNATSITTYWAGFFGNVTGSIVLQDASGNDFYNWSNANPTGEIFASRTQALDWATVGCTNSVEWAAEEAYIGSAATAADSLTNTFSSNAHPDFQVAGVTLSGCNSTNAFSSSGADSSLYHNILLADSGNATIYTTLINTTNQDGFDAGGWDFEMLVGENGTNPSTTTYYFFVELS